MNVVQSIDDGCLRLLEFFENILSLLLVFSFLLGFYVGIELGRLRGLTYFDKHLLFFLLLDLK